MAFDLTEYIKRNLIEGYKDGTWTKSKVAQLGIGYLGKGYLTVEDIAEIDSAISESEQQEEIDNVI